MNNPIINEDTGQTALDMLVEHHLEQTMYHLISLEDFSMNDGSYAQFQEHIILSDFSTINFLCDQFKCYVVCLYLFDDTDDEANLFTYDVRTQLGEMFIKVLRSCFIQHYSWDNDEEHLISLYRDYQDKVIQPILDLETRYLENSSIGSSFSESA